MLLNAMACCHSAGFYWQKRKQRYPANGEAPFLRQPSADRRAGTDCADRDGRWLDRRSHIYDMLFGTELVSCSDVARAMALRASQLLNVCSEA